MTGQPAGEQLPEIIYIDELLHTLYTTPLLPWLRQLDPAPVFDRRTPQCERGYIGRWKIEDDTLWLTAPIRALPICSTARTRWRRRGSPVP